MLTPNLLAISMGVSPVCTTYTMAVGVAIGTLGGGAVAAERVGVGRGVLVGRGVGNSMVAVGSGVLPPPNSPPEVDPSAAGVPFGVVVPPFEQALNAVAPSKMAHRNTVRIRGEVSQFISRKIILIDLFEMSTHAKT